MIAHEITDIDEEDDQDDLLEGTDIREDLAETTETGKPGHDAQTLESFQRALSNKTSCNVSAIIPSRSRTVSNKFAIFRALPRARRAFRLTPRSAVG